MYKITKTTKINEGNHFKNKRQKQVSILIHQSIQQIQEVPSKKSQDYPTTMRDFNKDKNNFY